MGHSRPRGVLPIAIKAKEEKFEGIILQKANVREAAVVSNLVVYGMNSIGEVIQFFNNEIELERTIVNSRKEFYTDQENVKRALEVACAGGHNLLFV